MPKYVANMMAVPTMAVKALLSSTSNLKLFTLGALRAWACVLVGGIVQGVLGC